MRVKFLVAPLMYISFAIAGDQDALDYVYSPDLPEDQQLLLDRINIHARNAEFDYALTLSQTLLDDAEPLRTTQPTVYGQILINHGIMQSVSEDYALGLSIIVRGLGFMELQTNPFSEDLINGIMAKALTELALQQHVIAEDSFRRAQHITHRQGGVYSEDQLVILSYLTATSLRQGNPLAADQQQLFSLRVAEQVYGFNSLKMLPTLSRLGSYFATRGSTIPAMVGPELRLQRVTLLKHSISMYDRAITIIEQNYGENDLRLIQPLRGLASARMLRVTSRKYAEQALARSLAIIESNPDSDLSDRAQALVDLGDYYVISSDARSMEIYKQAWELLQVSSESQRIAAGLFDTPVRLFPRNNPTLYLERIPDSAEPGEELFVDLEFGVTEQGRVHQVAVIEKNVPNEQVRLLRQRARNSRYRPRIVDGEIVATEGMVLHQSFRVISEPPPELPIDNDDLIESTVPDDKVF